MPPTAPHPSCKMRVRLQWIVENRKGFSSITDLSLKAGKAKGTLSNRLLDAERRGEEPNFDTGTLAAIAGVARVSLSWLMGTGKDPEASDVPPRPPPPRDIARKKFGRVVTETAELEARIASLEQELARLKQSK